MALKLLYTSFSGTLVADISDAAVLIAIDADSYTALSAVDFGAGEWTYLKLDNGAYSEEVKVTALSTYPYIAITRAQSGSIAQVFNAIDTVTTPVLGAAAITDIASAAAPTASITLSGTGLVDVDNTDPENPVVNVDPLNLTGGTGVVIVGDWPDIEIDLDPAYSGCCDGGGSGGSGGIDTLDITSDILTGSIVGTTLELALESPAFDSDGSVTISGTWPNIYFSDAGGSGGDGTVTSVSAGAGISITGTPTIAPTVALTATGVVAGTYAGVVVNAYGQLTTVPAGWNPLTSIAFAGSVGSAAYSGGAATITMVDADVGQRGLVELADSSSALDPGDTTSAVTPKSVLDAIGSTVSDAAGTGTGEADGLYTNILSSTAVSVTLLSGQKALLIGQVEVLNTGALLTPEAFGLAVFSSGSVKLAATKIHTQSNQIIMGILTGPMSTTTMSLVTTALGGSDVVYSAYLAVIEV